MSAKKVKEVDSIYSAGRKKRSRIFDDISCSSSNVSGRRWSSILSCCWKRQRARDEFTMKEYNSNEYDYIVEKLVIKRVPLSFYATEEDYEEFIEAKNYKETIQSPFIGSSAAREIKDKQVYSTRSGTGPPLHFLKNMTCDDLSSQPSNKNLRFNKDQDLLDEDAMQAGPSNYNGYASSRTREYEITNEYLNQFSALHPDLKARERPPKDPHPLNPPRSKRSLAESISEIASAQQQSPTSVKVNKKGKEKSRRDSNVYITVSDTSKDMSNVLRAEEKIPTHDKRTAKPALSIFRKFAGTSGLSNTQKSIETRKGESNDSQIATAQHRKLTGNSKARGPDPKLALDTSQFKVDYNSPKQNSTDKVQKGFNSSVSDPARLTIRRRNDMELSKRADEESAATDATSITSEDLRAAKLAGTTLRWKIIIKHHQSATASQTVSESASDLHEDSTNIPTLDDNPMRSKRMNTYEK